jgi:transcription antitermination factor NusG
MGEACLSIDKWTEEKCFSTDNGLAWYAVQTSYRCEQRVASGLSAKGFSTYLPLIREVHEWKDRRKTVDVPAFGGYLFVHCEPNLRNRVRVLETNGILRMLGGNHTPSPVSDLEIEDVRRALGSGVPCERCDAPAPGTLVEVMRGALAGVRGRVARIKNSFRLVITISAFAQAISAELSLDDVESIDESFRPNYSYQEN